MIKQNTGTRELNIDELEIVSGGTGFGDVVTYVKAYVAALGTPKLGSIYDGTDMGPGGVNSGSKGSGSPVCPGCHSPA